MGFFSKMFKYDQELEEQQRKQAMELQIELWKKQAELGQPMNIQADMDRLYGLDELERKKREKQQTKEIIKGAVAGGIVAGDAGAVVGAMTAKNKIDDRNRNQNNYVKNTQYNNIGIQTHTSVIPSDVSNAECTTDNSTSENDVPDAVKFYGSEEWQEIKERLLNDPNAKTGDLNKDVEYCTSQLKVTMCSDLTDILGLPLNKTRPALTPLMDRDEVERLEYRGKAIFIWKKDTHRAARAAATASTAVKAVSTAVALNYYNSVEWQNTKRTLMENGYIKTGCLDGDILYCLSQLKIAYLRDLSDILNESITVIRPKLTPLMDDNTVKRIENDGRAMFVMTNADFNSHAAVPVPASNNVNKFEEIKKYKELLDSGIITQEEFDTKKKELLGL